jgi:hypothetical protein
VLVLFLLIKVRFLSPPYSNCPGSTCLTHLGTEGKWDEFRSLAHMAKANIGWRLGRNEKIVSEQ